MEAIIKEQLEKGKFRIKESRFNPKVKAMLGMSKGYFLRVRGKWVFLGLKRDVEATFRRVILKTYGDNYFFRDLPDSYFKRWIHADFTLKTKATKEGNKTKQAYYKKMRIERRERKIKIKIKKLEEEIILLKGGNQE